MRPHVDAHLVDPLDKAVHRNVKTENQVPTEVDRANDLIRNALRAVEALAQLPEIETEMKFKEFYNRVMGRPKLRDMLHGIQQERTSETW